MRNLRVGIIGDFDGSFGPHRQTNASLEHVSMGLGVRVEGEWLATDEPQEYGSYAALWCAPGSPYRSLAGALEGVHFAREKGVPFLATCGGFQHVVLEYARNVLGFQDAAHAEYDPYASTLFVQPLSCSLKGQLLSVELLPDSRAARAYGCLAVEERYYCDFGLNPAYQELLEVRGLKVSGWDRSREARVVEIPAHPFYVATLYVPQSRSVEGQPHPLILAFVNTALQRLAGFGS